MSESFEKFLINNFHRAKNIPLSDEEFVKVKDLGEWAWKQLVERSDKFVQSIKDFESEQKSRKEYGIKLWGNIYDYMVNTFYFDMWKKEMFGIAVGCLGKKEIEKRLKELEKVKTNE